MKPENNATKTEKQNRKNYELVGGGWWYEITTSVTVKYNIK